MGRYVFKLPDVGEGTAEAEIVAWHRKAIGDDIHEDQNMVDVMTDKATVEMTSPVSGKVIAIHGEPGAMAAVGAPLVELEVEGAGNVSGKAAPARNRSAEGLKHQSRKQKPKPEAGSPTPKAQSLRITTRHAHRPLLLSRRARKATKPVASPAVRHRAEEMGIKLQFVPGTGPGVTHQPPKISTPISPAAVAAALRTAAVTLSVMALKK